MMAPLVMAGLMVVVTRRPVYGLFALLSPIMMLANRWESRHRRLRSMSADSRRYQRELADFRAELAGACQAEVSYRPAAHPALPPPARGGRLPSPRPREAAGRHPPRRRGLRVARRRPS